MSWNYRVGKKTEIIPSLKEGGEDQETELHYIVECYYEDEKIVGYSMPNVLQAWEEVEDLKNTYDLIAGAFQKPVVDLDELDRRDQNFES